MCVCVCVCLCLCVCQCESSQPYLAQLLFAFRSVRGHGAMRSNFRTAGPVPAERARAALAEQQSSRSAPPSRCCLGGFCVGVVVGVALLALLLEWLVQTENAAGNA